MGVGCKPFGKFQSILKKLENQHMAAEKAAKKANSKKDKTEKKS